MAKVELKAPIVDEISEKIKGAHAAVLVDHRGLTVEQDTQLRRQLREAGVSYKVYKNTMMKRAFEGTDFAELDKLLDGPSALALAEDDVTAPARVLVKFAKTADKLEIKGAVIEGEYYDVKGVEELAKIPSREELLGRLFGSWKSPISNIARVLNQIAEKTPEGGTAKDAVEASEAPAAEAAPAEETAPAQTEETPAEAPAEAEAPAAEETKKEEE
ncbi:MAG: 50S ribosomal protein L10 [Lachnospiraceae bacterium]|nr:50S ribosomal protein L10 [Lachnospiraceae bacterium]MBQ9606676.1 50S ribosomal protein L10 [Lachnospiraceae bacterium]MBR1524782.1 50S ribosomal protein L10 [Lachnospiraceae bacterium]